MNENEQTAHTIRPATAADLDRIKEIAVAADMFSVEEAEFFDEMLHGALDGSLDGHRWLVVETADGTTVSAAQFAPEPFADRLWNLYFIAVDPTHQGLGIGSAVMAHVEAELTRPQGRLLEATQLKQARHLGPQRELRRRIAVPEFFGDRNPLLDVMS